MNQLIKEIYSAEGQFSLAITGGGTSAIASLLSVAGASSTILEAGVPYHSTALRRYVSATSVPGCNAQTARAMAMAAYLSARSMNTGKPVFGLGCTAAIATNRERRGADRCHIAVQGGDFTFACDIELRKQDSRAEQEAICCAAIIDVMASVLGVASLREGPGMRLSHIQAPAAWRQLLAGESLSSATGTYRAIFPGSFNPFHEGHRGIAKYASQRLGEQVALEISVRNVDKPPLDFLTMSERQTSEFDLVFTNAPTFVEKSGLFPGCTFIVGLDTLTRIDEPKYYGSDAARNAALTKMAAAGNRFLVFGRATADGFKTLRDVQLSAQLKEMSEGVEENEFRLDISSSGIRELENSESQQR